MFVIIIISGNHEVMKIGNYDWLKTVE